MTTLLLAGATFTFRAINLGSSWDIHVDEITYLRISENVAEHLRIELYGEPFYLHPPAYFFAQAALLKVLPRDASTIDQIYNLRYLNAAFAALSAALVFGIGWRVAGFWAGIGAAALFALDPFAIRINSQTLLETFAGFWILAGWAILIGDVSRQSTLRRSSPWTVVAAGVAFGLALLTKEKVALVTILPLLACFATQWALPRLKAAYTASVAMAVYAIYPMSVAILGDWVPFSEAKFSGLARFVGAIKITGFKRAGGPSLFEALAANFSAYGTAYVLMFTGALALTVLIAQRRSASRLLAVWLASAYVMLTFSVLIGTLEEQFFYYLIVPAMIATASSALLLFETRTAVANRRLMSAALYLCVAGFAVWMGTTWWQVHLTPSNASEKLQAYLVGNVPLDSRISTTTEESQFLVKGYRTGIWTTPAVLGLNRAQYVVLSTRQTADGYGYAKPGLLKWLDRNGTVVFAASSRTYGTLRLYRLPTDLTSRVASKVPSKGTGATTHVTDELAGTRARASRLTEQLRLLRLSGKTTIEDLRLVRLDLQVTQDSVARLSGATGTYKVRAGDTLSKISLDYYGSANRWPEIAAANAFLRDPNLLVLDMVLVIP